MLLSGLSTGPPRLLPDLFFFSYNAPFNLPCPTPYHIFLWISSRFFSSSNPFCNSLLTKGSFSSQHIHFLLARYPVYVPSLPASCINNCGMLCYKRRKISISSQILFTYLPNHTAPYSKTPNSSLWERQAWTSRKVMIRVYKSWTIGRPGEQIL